MLATPMLGQLGWELPEAPWPANPAYLRRPKTKVDNTQGTRPKVDQQPTDTTKTLKQKKNDKRKAHTQSQFLLRQEDQKFKVILGYIVGLMSAQAM